MNFDFLTNYEYDYENNRLFVRSKGGMEFDLELRAPITVIEGDSATGKSYLVSKIEEINRVNEKLKKEKNVITMVSAKEFLLEDKEQLVIIDRADIWLTKDMQEQIKKCKKCRFLIMMRGLHDFNLTPNYYATLKRNNNEVTLYFEFNERLWFK